MTRSVFFLVASMGIVASCAPRAPRAATPPPVPPALHVPSTERADFVTEQVVEASHDGRVFTFRAVVEKTGARVVIVILTSFGVRAVTLTQEGRELHVERHLPRDLPFPPEYIAADVGTSLVVGFPIDVRSDGVLSRTFEGDRFEDRIEGGVLRERVVHASDGRAATTIRYDAPGMTRDGTPPPRFVVENASLRYRLTITTERYRPTSP